MSGAGRQHPVRVGALRTAIIVAGHDLAAEARRPVAATGTLLFTASSLVVLHLALAGGGAPTPSVVAGALWVVLVFGALGASTRVLAVEREEGTWDALVASPCPRPGLQLGKVLGALALAVLLHALLLPLYLGLFGAPGGVDGVALLVGAVVLADTGFAVVGVLVGSLALRARGRDLLAPAIFLPLAMPLVIAAVTASLHAYGAAPDADPLQLLGFLAVYDATFLLAGMVALPELATE